MDQSQEERQAAAEAFIESLNQLENLQSAESDGSSACAGQPASPIPDRPIQPYQPPKAASISLNALEDAAADIEQFMQAR